MELEGKTALVTGGGQGIGLAIVRALARSGARVALNDTGFSIDGKEMDSGLARKMADELAKEGFQVFPSAENAASLEGAERLYDEVRNVFGPVDILVNNAAILQDRMVFNMDPRSWDAVMANNLAAPFYLTHLVSQEMRKRMWGRIVNMVSSSGLIGNHGQANYGAAKGGLVALSRISALDLARYGVTVNAIAPFAHTRVTDTIQPTTPWLVDYLATVKGVASPESVALLTRYLCTDKAKVVTGQVFGVRGRELFLFSQPRPTGVMVEEGEGDPSEAFVERAFSTWDRKGTFTPLETDLMVMSKRLNRPADPEEGSP